MSEREEDSPRCEDHSPRAYDRVRAWLRVPFGIALPRWVETRLFDNVAHELEARCGRPLDETVFGIVDLETTGLSPDHCRILEIGLVALRGTRVLGRMGTLVDVGAPVPSGITALTGIDDAQLVGAPCEGDALAQMAEFLFEHRIDVLVAHNARFDRGFLTRAWRFHDRAPALPSFLCSVQLARRFVKSPRYSLDALVSHLSIPERARHRALGDAEMTADLWIELVARARLSGIHTLEALCGKCEVKTRPRRRSRIRVVESFA